MLTSHLNAIEAVLLAQSETANNAGHPNLRGGPREWFVRDFLESHLPSTLEVGQGEVIDHHSKPGGEPDRRRPQVDIVLYRRDMPRIRLSQQDRIFLAVGVGATIEVKSTLRRDGRGGVGRLCEVSRHHKRLERPLPSDYSVSGWFPKQIVTYAVAFDGPKRMRTVAGWLDRVSKEMSIPETDQLDFIAVLGRGCLWRLKAFPTLQLDEGIGNASWAFLDQKDSNLVVLFSHLLSWVTSTSFPMSTLEYVAFPNRRVQTL